jgi:hypothetical protein
MEVPDYIARTYQKLIDLHLAEGELQDAACVLDGFANFWLQVNCPQREGWE